MSELNFNAQFSEPSGSSNFPINMEEVTIVFNVEFGDFITLYRGVERVWIGNGTNGDIGVLYAEMIDGAIQIVGPVSSYYYALQAGFQGTFVEWVQLLLDATVNAQNAAQSASEALASEQAAASSEAAAAASEVSAEQWATGGTGATYSSGKSAKEQADRAAMWAVGTSSGNGSATNNAKYWSDLAQSAKNTAVSAKDTAVASEAVAVAKASDSEAWAVGQRGGSDVPSTDQTYQNNSKYYAEIAVAGRRWIAYNWDDDPTRAFEVGEFVTKDDTIYMFIAPHAANTPWSLNEVEVTNLGALLKDLQDNVVLVQQEEPTSENNKIWLKPSNIDVYIATMDDLYKLPDIKSTSGSTADLDVTDDDGNVLVRFEDGHIKTKNFDSSHKKIRTRMEFGAHNGAEYYAPECTVPAYRIAGQQGWEWAWIAGIALSADNCMYVIHDDTVDRTTDGTGRIDQMTSVEINALNITQTGAGYNLTDFDPAELKIPTFEQVLEQCVRYGMKMMLRVSLLPTSKNTPENTAIWDHFEHLLKGYGVSVDDISCYVDGWTKALTCRSVFGEDVEITTHLGINATAQDFVDWFESRNITGKKGAILSYQNTNAEAVKLLHEHGIRVYSYGSGIQENVDICASLGVDIYQNGKIHEISY